MGWWWWIACQPVEEGGGGAGPFPELEDLAVQPEPPPLAVTRDGRLVHEPALWHQVRREELRAMLEHYVYGRPGDWPPPSRGPVRRSPGPAGGELWQAEVSVGETSFQLALFLPPGGGPAPVLLGLNKCGNTEVFEDPALAPARWAPDDCEGRPGERAGSWTVEATLERGWAVATLAQGDLQPDSAVADQEGWIQTFPAEGPREGGWGAVAVWAAGLQAAAQVLAEQPEVDARRLVAWGHSRRGKAALWAAAHEPRLAAVWAHQSGIGGQALTRGSTGEDVSAITTLFPHWFNGRYPWFAGQEDRLPTDQHALLALLAPRPLRVTDGDEDLWAFPDGAAAATELASPIWALHGAPAPTWWLRPGGHDVRPEDWAAALDWLEEHLPGPGRPEAPGDR